VDAPESMCQSSHDRSSEKRCLSYAACCLPQEYHCFKLRMGQHGYIQTQILKYCCRNSPFLPSLLLFCHQLKSTGSRFLAQTRACCMHFPHQMDTTIKLFLHHFLQACAKHATQVSPWKPLLAASASVAAGGLAVRSLLTAGLPSQCVNFKQTRSAL